MKELNLFGRRGLPLAALAFLMTFAARPAWADLVYLTNGRVLAGEVVAEDKQFITIRFAKGTMKIRVEQVKRIERQTPVEYRLHLAAALLREGRHEAALEELEAAAKLKPDDPEARKELIAHLGTCARQLHQARRLAEAKEVYRRVLELEPENQAAAAGLLKLGDQDQELERLLVAARLSLAQQDLEAAERKFREALAQSPDARTRAAGDLGLLYALRGEGHYKAGRYSEAARALEQAFSFDPGLANRLENLYAASGLLAVFKDHAEGRTEAAQKTLARVLAFAPANQRALYVAGRLEEARGNAAGAAAFYAKGLRLAAPAVAEAAEVWRKRLEKELGLEGPRISFSVEPVDAAAYAQSAPGDFEVLRNERFEVLHHNPALASAAMLVLESQRERIEELLGLETPWKQKARVYLHRNQEEYSRATGQGEWTGGISRFVRIGRAPPVKLEIHSWQTSPRLLRSVLPHELTHLIVNQALADGDALPRALHEGLAVLMEPSYRHEYFLDFLRLRLRSQAYIPLGELLRLQDYPRDPDFFYAESFALVAYLVEKHGLAAAARLIPGPNSKGGPEAAEATLLAITRQPSLERLETAWRAWLPKAEVPQLPLAGSVKAR